MNYLKSTLIEVLSILAVFSTTTYAQKTSISGYITYLKINIQGWECDLILSNTPTGARAQHKGTWDCSSILDLKTFETARTAMLSNAEVIVTFKKTNKSYDPVLSVLIK